MTTSSSRSGKSAGLLVCTGSPRAYTVGLTLLGRPELVVTGMRTRRVHPLLNDAAAKVRRDGPPSPGDRLLVAAGRRWRSWS
jgi:hypothetical protein